MYQPILSSFVITWGGKLWYHSRNTFFISITVCCFIAAIEINDVDVKEIQAGTALLLSCLYFVTSLLWIDWNAFQFEQVESLLHALLQYINQFFPPLPYRRGKLWYHPCNTFFIIITLRCFIVDVETEDVDIQEIQAGIALLLSYIYFATSLPPTSVVTVWKSLYLVQ